VGKARTLFVESSMAAFLGTDEDRTLPKSVDRRLSPRARLCRGDILAAPGRQADDGGQGRRRKEGIPLQLSSVHYKRGPGFRRGPCPFFRSIDYWPSRGTPPQLVIVTVEFSQWLELATELELVNTTFHDTVCVPSPLTTKPDDVLLDDTLAVATGFGLPTDVWYSCPLTSLPATQSAPVYSWMLSVPTRSAVPLSDETVPVSFGIQFWADVAVDVSAIVTCSVPSEGSGQAFGVVPLVFTGSPLYDATNV
jgi:hypothetical protein